ncbi:MAG: hypothetical protein KC621_30490, partial [Myxococcales bacterium]|nr:hypothetical protein [Myxococcales bacterium]
MREAIELVAAGFDDLVAEQLEGPGPSGSADDHARARRRHPSPRQRREDLPPLDLVAARASLHD